ncbi:ankyrin repeat and MYND domain-containing protein 1 isoform X2 [Ornithorhynchus anatinus]|uniref:Ankyrin repeat and MYND domain containing 1 n=1 Tax=Ornithorhynchus anatinus TaxID=9258 RepID=A0A6I8PHH9_ORNAN|nr:ankyrin repeat and MYND domain-containing protein 1 isoform X2 [Ornithorhynchus anatinus]
MAVPKTHMEVVSEHSLKSLDGAGNCKSIEEIPKANSLIPALETEGYSDDLERTLSELVADKIKSVGQPENQRKDYIQRTTGVQKWQDGSVYTGEFALNMKEGFGKFSWANGETYEGEFYKDHRHGFGTYSWPSGSSFTGTFYLSHIEGYGTMNFTNKIFKGLYKADERFGPGVETYPDDREDVGLWFRNHLIKLCTEIPDHFSILDYPEYTDFLEDDSIKVTRFEKEFSKWELNEEKDPFWYNYKQLLLDDNFTFPKEISFYSTDNDNLPMTCSFRKDLDSHFFVNENDTYDEEEEARLINRTPLMVKMQKHIYKFRHKQDHTGFNINSILSGNRTDFGPQGPKELTSELMITKAAEGDFERVYEILRDNLAHPDVADKIGYTALAAASVNCHNDIINLLLDNGADVNKCTDEGLTVLCICFIIYFPVKSFKRNIAERNFTEYQVKNQNDSELPASRTQISSISLTKALSQIEQEEKKNLSDSSHRLDLSFSRTTFLDEYNPLDIEITVLRSQSTLTELASEKELRISFERTLDDDVFERCTQYSTETIFESNQCICNFSLPVSQKNLEKSANIFSLLKANSDSKISMNEGTMRNMAFAIIEHRNRWTTINLLLRRGADPNLCHVPMQALFLAIKAADVEAVKLLLKYGARTDIRFPSKMKGLTPLHIAVALPGEEGVKITELLLHAITNPDTRAEDQDDIYGPDVFEFSPSSMKLNNELGPPSGYYTKSDIIPEEGGRTPLHVVCEREDNYKYARDIIRLLLAHKANPNSLWSGHSPLSLSIASGNDLIDKLIHFGADILNPITFGEEKKTVVGTAVDYAFYRFFQDKRIAQTPYHSLSVVERETFVARRKLLEYIGACVPKAVTLKEKEWDQHLLQKSKKMETLENQRRRRIAATGKSPPGKVERIPFFKFCYQCGRSIGVRLSPCLRCYRVFTCSKNCKTKFWNEVHKQECGGEKRNYKSVTLRSESRSSKEKEVFKKDGRGSALKLGIAAKASSSSTLLPENYSFN